MLKLQAWLERSWRFGLSLEVLPAVVERVRGTPCRLEEILLALPAAHRTRRPGEGEWSAQEHAGHLIDLDELHLARMDDFAEGAPVLRAADMQNRVTQAAQYNTRPTREILARFRHERMAFVSRVESLDCATLLRTSLHPRLEVPLRAIDVVEFVADHDDHHLARMMAIARALTATDAA